MAVSVFRSIILYLAVVLAVRIMGKRQIGELQPSELVITIMISELAALPLQDLNMPLIWGIMPMFLMVGFELLMSLIALKSMKFRGIFYGRPVLLIYQGTVNQYELLRTRVSMEDIMEAMRGSGLLKVEDIQMAVLETNGTISVIPKPQAAPPTAEDLGIAVEETGGIPMILVMNGYKVEKNLKLKNIGERDLDHILRGYQIKLEDVFMLTMDDHKKTFLIKQEKR
ncbi:MAG: DUF421 domain-containing protein [Clostridia bacterium]|nr:DUF421 domain-containing protein [Clostridia bacterium]